MHRAVGRAAVAIGAAAIAALVVSTVAVAAAGDLTPQDCVDDNDSGADACAQSTDGLGDPRSVALSPDGTSLYVAAEADDAIAWFDRDPGSGALTPRGCVEDGDVGQGPDGCSQSTDGLDAPEAVVVSPDGKSVYAGSASDQAVVRFDRNTTTGALTPQGCVDDDDTGPDTCGQSADGLNNVAAVTVSPDGKSVYAGSINDDAIVRFARDPGDGALTPQGCLDDNDSGTDGCTQNTDGLDSVNSIAISSDGLSLYTAAGNDDAIARFARDTGDGALTPQGCVDDNDPLAGPDTCAQSTDGLEGARSVAITSDGGSVYAAGRFDDAIVRFDRSAAGGALTPQGCLEDNDPPQGPDNCAQGTDGLDDASSVVPSPDGQSLYASSQADDAVVRLARAPATGAITPLGCVDDNDAPAGPDTCAQMADGLETAVALAISGDGASLYSAGVGDDAIARFAHELPPSPAPPPTGDTFPPDTKITKGPKKKTFKRHVKFEFGGSEPGVTIECQLDDDGFEPCTSPVKLKGLKRGKHMFAVRAIDQAGNPDPVPADRSWKVTKKHKH